jgi:hypothetical protein
MFTARHPAIALTSLFFAISLAVIAAMTAASAQAEPAATKSSVVVSLDGTSWQLATDPKNVGRAEKWWEKPRPDAKPTKVPWIIQDVFSDYHGVAWYWRDFTPPARVEPEGRYLLRFLAVDYLAEVWLNGVRVGTHEGGETPFTFDVTDALKPGESNRLAVRVLNPTYEPIDGIALKETPSGGKQYPVASNASYNVGGIVDSVELIAAPAARVECLHVIPDWRTGEIRVRVNLRNAAARPVQGSLQVTVCPAGGGEMSAIKTLEQTIPPGDMAVETVLRVENHRLWQLADPYLYRVAARVQAAGSAAVDEQSTRCGFRDFRFENGYFRLNGKRIFLHGTMHCPYYPVGWTCPSDADMMRRDVLHAKAMGLNLCRIAFGGSTPRQIDVCDEMGMLVYQEHYASWQLGLPPRKGRTAEDLSRMRQRFDRSLSEIVLRDRNHPSIVIWGFLNEPTGGDDPAFRYGVESLPLIRRLDETRMCFLNSSRSDGDYSIGSLSNPGSHKWESDLRDVHLYPGARHEHALRVVDSFEDYIAYVQNRKLPMTNYPLFISEYGQCGAVDLARVLRRFEQAGKEQADDARYFRRQMEKFLVDWQQWQLDQCWARPEDFFLDSHRNLAKMRTIGENILRANPHLVGLCTTHALADGVMGSAPTNNFREPKPGLLDAVCELTSPLRWSLFVEPKNVYRSARVKLEAVLVNEDVLRPGKYPLRLQVIGPKGTSLWEKTIMVEIPQRGGKVEPRFVQPVFAEEITADTSSGRCRFLATFLQGGVPRGDETEFYVADRAEMPTVDVPVVLWGDDPGLRGWLSGLGVKVQDFAPGGQTARQLILASGKPPVSNGVPAFAELARQIARGSAVVFLDHRMFSDGKNATRWVPLREKGTWAMTFFAGGFYRADSWAKNHPIFDGLPAGGIMDPTFYWDLVPYESFCRCYSTDGFSMTQEEKTAGLDKPAEAICGANRMSFNYASALHVAVYRLGAGEFTLNALPIRENLGQVPVAERLLRNMLRYAARDAAKPLADLPADFDQQLKSLGY